MGMIREIIPKSPRSGQYFYTGKEVLKLRSSSNYLIFGWYNPRTREWKERILLEYPVIINGEKTPPIDIDFPAVVPIFQRDGRDFIYYYSNGYETFAIQVEEDSVIAYHKRGGNLHRLMTVPLKAYLREKEREAV